MQYLQYTIVFALLAACLTAPLEPSSPADDDEEVDSVQYEYWYEDSTSESEYSPDLNVSQRLIISETPPKHYLLSMATSQFVAVTKSGRVNANSQIGRLVAQFYTLYTLVDEQEYVSLQSVKHESRGWYLTLQSNSKFRGKLPDASSRNELFEVVTLYGSTFALKAYNARTTVDNGSGDGGTEDCFLGFSTSDGRPACYSSADLVDTHLVFLDAGLL